MLITAALRTESSLSETAKWRSLLIA